MNIETAIPPFTKFLEFLVRVRQTQEACIVVLANPIVPRVRHPHRQAPKLAPPQVEGGSMTDEELDSEDRHNPCRYTMKSSTLESYHYGEDFGLLFQQLFEDDAIQDAALHEEAREYLKVLDRPEMAHYNLPSWVVSFMERQPGRTFGITMKRVIEALYQTAADFDMPRSARFISACICADGRLRREECGSDPDLEADVMAEDLAGLGADLLMDIVNPFFSVELIRGKMVPPFECLTAKLAERDGYSCVFCGGAFASTSKSQCTQHLLALDISPARIFYHTVSEHPITTPCKPSEVSASDESVGMRALETLRYYCGYPDTASVHPFSPRNCMLMHDRAAWAFASLLWCLKPTQTVNRYDIVLFGPNEVGGKPVEWVHFYNEDTGDPVHCSPVAPPDPNIVRVHAMAATLLHHSGATGLFCFPYVAQRKGLVPRHRPRPVDIAEEKPPVYNFAEDKRSRRHHRWSFHRRIVKFFQASM